jgi:hypothetical protein
LIFGDKVKQEIGDDTKFMLKMNVIAQKGHLTHSTAAMTFVLATNKYRLGDQWHIIRIIHFFTRLDTVVNFEILMAFSHLFLILVTCFLTRYLWHGFPI